MTWCCSHHFLWLYGGASCWGNLQWNWISQVLRWWNFLKQNL